MKKWLEVIIVCTFLNGSIHDDSVLAPTEPIQTINIFENNEIEATIIGIKRTTVPIAPSEETDPPDGADPPDVTNPPDGTDPQDGTDPPDGTDPVGTTQPSVTTDDSTQTGPMFATLTTLEPPTTLNEPTTERDEEPDSDDEAFHKDLTADAVLALLNRTGDVPSNVSDSDMLNDNTMQAWMFATEWKKDIRHFADQKSFLRVCYYLATTYKNAILDIRKYYQIRFLYVQNMEYEIGYVTHEIVYKYQIVLELFHLVQRKYEHHPYKYFAPTPYMFYMYTNILHQCTDIIHLCNMMHEIEKKHRNNPYLGVFFNSQEVVPEYGNKTYNEKKVELDEYLFKRQAMLKKQEKLRRLRMKAMRKGNMSFYRTTVRRVSKRSKYWNINYGWSIEDW